MLNNPNINLFMLFVFIIIFPIILSNTNWREVKLTIRYLIAAMAREVYLRLK